MLDDVCLNYVYKYSTYSTMAASLYFASSRLQMLQAQTDSF